MHFGANQRNELDLGIATATGILAGSRERSLNITANMGGTTSMTGAA
jgi:hypothetical protein